MNNNNNVFLLFLLFYNFRVDLHSRWFALFCFSGQNSNIQNRKSQILRWYFRIICVSEFSENNLDRWSEKALPPCKENLWQTFQVEVRIHIQVSSVDSIEELSLLRMKHLLGCRQKSFDCFFLHEELADSNLYFKLQEAWRKSSEAGKARHKLTLYLKVDKSRTQNESSWKCSRSHSLTEVCFNSSTGQAIPQPRVNQSLGDVNSLSYARSCIQFLLWIRGIASIKIGGCCLCFRFFHSEQRNSVFRLRWLWRCCLCLSSPCPLGASPQQPWDTQSSSVLKFVGLVPLADFKGFESRRGQSGTPSWDGYPWVFSVGAQGVIPSF